LRKPAPGIFEIEPNLIFPAASFDPTVRTRKHEIVSCSVAGSKQTQCLEERLAQEAKRRREEAKSLPLGITRDELIRKGRQCETGSHMSDWLSSPGLQPPD
jgi:hypothetical protein